MTAVGRRPMNRPQLAHRQGFLEHMQAFKAPRVIEKKG